MEVIGHALRYLRPKSPGARGGELWNTTSKILLHLSISLHCMLFMFIVVQNNRISIEICFDLSLVGTSSRGFEIKAKGKLI